MDYGPVAQVGGGGPGAIVIPQVSVTVSVAAMPEESIASAVKLKAPEAVAVPVMAPDAGFRLRPGGNEPPVIENVYGEIPPVATGWSHMRRQPVPIQPRRPTSRLSRSMEPDSCLDRSRLWSWWTRS
jgi:hypothetical protein